MIDFAFERADGGSLVGNIYKGRVVKTLPGMRAAFVDCGLEKNCYMSQDDFLPEGEKYGNTAEAEEPFNIKEGDDVLVRVVNPPIDNKGAKVTPRLSFVGKGLIYLPDTPFVGVSKKIEDDELRRNLEFTARSLISKGEGLIVRTAAPYARRDRLEEELNFLRSQYEEVVAAYKDAETGALLYADSALPVRVMRDILSDDIDSFIIGSPELEKTVSDMAKRYPARTKRKIILHDTGRDMMADLGISGQVLEMLSPKVPLDNGGYIVIEHTEALTAVDVNTGSFTGDDNLEQTVYYTDILAAREIARQVRLRNIGGIVVVDFIDMRDPAHKEAVVEELKRALSKDKTKCVVSPMSRLGLVEFSRKRTGRAALAGITKPCPRCGGSGAEVCPEFALIGMRAKILKALSDGAAGALAEISREAFERLISWEDMREDIKRHALNTPVYAVARDDFAAGDMKIKSAPFALPDGAIKI